ncbi:MAG TPA: hypothetical protein ENO23_08405, partial [Alphaproteobacteria bacterium]|nr:hypothetical protein [Alphaproteobacteria bacterium]
MNAILPPERPFPARMGELGQAEHLVAWGFRRWVAGHADGNGHHWAMVWNDFARTLGTGDGRDALGGLEAMVRAVLTGAPRPLACHRPCCPLLSADEFRIVAMVAACQAGNWTAAGCLAEWLAGPDGVGDLLQAASQLAMA